MEQELIELFDKKGWLYEKKSEKFILPFKVLGIKIKLLISYQRDQILLQAIQKRTFHTLNTSRLFQTLNEFNKSLLIGNCFYEKDYQFLIYQNSMNTKLIEKCYESFESRVEMTLYISTRLSKITIQESNINLPFSFN